MTLSFKAIRARATEYRAKLKEYPDLERAFGTIEQTETEFLLAEIDRLRQGLWDCVAISGSDTDGQLTPDALTYPDIVDYAKQEVQQLRDDYNEALAECTVHDT